MSYICTIYMSYTHVKYSWYAAENMTKIAGGNALRSVSQSLNTDLKTYVITCGDLQIYARPCD